MNNSLSQKYANLLEVLFKKTSDSSLSWVYDSDKSSCYVVIGDRKIELFPSRNESEDPLFVVRIIKSDGSVSDVFSDEDVYDSEYIGINFGGAYTIMKMLHENAKSIALGLGVDVDEIIKDLSGM